MYKFLIITFLTVSLTLTSAVQCQEANIFGYSKEELEYLIWLSYAKSSVAKETGTLVGGKRMIECYAHAAVQSMSPFQFKVAAHEYARKKQTQKRIAALKLDMRDAAMYEQSFVNHLNTLEIK